MVEAKGVQGGISWGKTLNKAKKMIVEAIEGAIEAKAIAEAERRGIVHLNDKKYPFSVT